MSNAAEDDRKALEGLLGEDPAAHARYAGLADYQKEMCLRWIADAPTPVLREGRICRLATYLRTFSLDPHYDLGILAFGELHDLYGPAQPLRRLAPEERTLALQEQRVLGG